MFFIFTLNGAPALLLLSLMRTPAHAHGAADALTLAFSRLAMRAQCRTSTSRACCCRRVRGRVSASCAQCNVCSLALLQQKVDSSPTAHQAWNCFTTSDGVSKMRNDPTTICTSAAHLSFRKMATAIIVIVGPGVPLGYAFWIRRLRRVATNEHLLARSAWRGLADPMTRRSWGACAARQCMPRAPTPRLACTFTVHLHHSRAPATRQTLHPVRRPVRNVPLLGRGERAGE